jgi:hypothetical protein
MDFGRDGTSWECWLAAHVGVELDGERIPIARIATDLLKSAYRAETSWGSVANILAWNCLEPWLASTGGGEHRAARAREPK